MIVQQSALLSDASVERQIVFVVHDVIREIKNVVIMMIDPSIC